MFRNMLIKFLKDRSLFVLFYFINMTCIITFYHLSTSNNVEYLYPIITGLFLLTAFLVIDLIRYYEFNKNVELLIEGKSAELRPFTKEQKLLTNLIKKNKSDYTRDKSELKTMNKERLYFLSHWMHHLKTPVSVIELIVEKEGYQENSKKEALEQIKRENKRLHSSIEQGLTMIRMESFENDMEPQSIDLVASLRKVINDRKSEFIYNQLYPSIQFEQETAFVVTDKKWNEILLGQLLSNAIKYSYHQDGSKKVIFRITDEEQGVTLSIKDEGVGIPKYDMDRIFEAFFTGENGRRFRNSSGIGLYLCKKISEKLGQTITVKSEISKGTEVQVKYLTKM